MDQVLKPDNVKANLSRIYLKKEELVYFNERVANLFINFYHSVQHFKKKLMFPGKKLSHTLVINSGLAKELIKILLKHENIPFAICVYISLLENAKFCEKSDLLKEYQILLTEIKNTRYDSKRLIKELNDIWKLINTLDQEGEFKGNSLDKFLNINSSHIYKLFIQINTENKQATISTNLSNKILSTFVSYEDYKSASKWIKMIDQLEIPKDLRTYNILLHYSIKTINFKGFINHLNKLLDSKIKPDTVTCNTLLSSLNKFSSPLLYPTIIKILEEHRFEPNELTSSIVLPLKNKIKDTKFISFLDDKVIPKLDTGLKSVQISLFKDQLKNSKPTEQEFETILNELLNTEVKSECYKYGIMIVELIRQGEYERAELILEAMIKKQNTPTIQILTCLTHNYLSENMIEKAAEKLLQMVKFGYSPSKLMVQQIVIGMYKGGFIKQANEFIVNITQLGYIPTRRMVNSQLNQLIKEDKLKTAISMFKEIVKSGFVADTCTYNILLKGGINQKDYYLVRSLINEMTENQIPMDQITFMELFKGSYYDFNHSLAAQFYNKLKESSFLLDHRVKHHLHKHQRINLHVTNKK
ncbi:hypothetical protein K502DRAFT_326778 [Neoconidiobolus thromboides FSU 785]|nr:hypothetical protein K502DRAFT_326778 [Neoconidiobolus thromboides FSU 785]